MVDSHDRRVSRSGVRPKPSKKAKKTTEGGSNDIANRSGFEERVARNRRLLGIKDQPAEESSSQSPEGN